MIPAALAELLADMSRDLDVRLADMRRSDAIRDVARCTSPEQVAAVSRRFEIARLVVEDDDGPTGSGVEGRLQ
jgi:hypothetical protein